MSKNVFFLVAYVLPTGALVGAATHNLLLCPATWLFMTFLFRLVAYRGR